MINLQIVYDSSSDSSILRKWGVRQEEIKRGEREMKDAVFLCFIYSI